MQAQRDIKPTRKLGYFVRMVVLDVLCVKSSWYFIPLMHLLKQLIRKIEKKFYSVTGKQDLYDFLTRHKDRCANKMEEQLEDHYREVRDSEE